MKKLWINFSFLILCLTYQDVIKAQTADSSSSVQVTRTNIYYSPEGCIGEPSHDFDEMSFARRFYNFEKTNFTEIINNVVYRNNLLMKKTRNLVYSEELRLVVYSIFNRQMASSALNPAIKLKEISNEEDDQDTIWLPLSFSRAANIPTGLLPLIVKDGLVNTDEYILEGYEHVRNDRFDRAKSENLDNSKLKEILTFSDSIRESIYFDHPIYRSIISHEFGHNIFNINIAYYLTKDLNQEDHFDKDTFLFTENFRNIRKRFNNREEIRRILDNDKIRSYRDSSTQSGDEESGEIESLRKKLRQYPEVNKMREAIYSVESFTKFLTPYNEFFADFISVMHDSMEDELPLGTSNIVALFERERKEYDDFRAFNNRNLVKSLDDSSLPFPHYFIGTPDEHHTITYPRVYLYDYIKKAQTLEQKQELVGLVVKSVREVLQNRLDNDVYGIDFILIYPRMTFPGMDPIELRDVKHIRDINKDLLNALKRNLEKPTVNTAIVKRSTHPGLQQIWKLQIPNQSEYGPLKPGL